MGRAVTSEPRGPAHSRKAGPPRAVWRLLPAACCLLGGCVGAGRPTPAAPPYAGAPLTLSSAKAVPYVAAHDTAQAARVLEVGNKLLAANPEINLRPIFVVPGTPAPEVSHRGEHEIIISEALVRQCLTDGQLAAILSLELAKITAERQARLDVLAATGGREPPMELRFGNDGSGFDDSDEFYKAELVKLGQDRRKPRASSTPPDPRLTARQYLRRAGYTEHELELAQPILKAAKHAAATERGPQR